jgi:hypothetical protein
MERHSQIDNILIDRRRHSRLLEVRSFRGADCNIGHYLVVAKVRERLAVGKQATQKFEMESKLIIIQTLDIALFVMLFAILIFVISSTPF